MIGVLALAGCRGLQAGSPVLSAPTAGNGTVTSSSGIQKVNHIIILMQENRSFDHYFGKINAYRAAQGLGKDVDGLPDDDTTITNIGYDGSVQHPHHAPNICTQDLSSAWNESRADVNITQQGAYSYPVSPAKMDGFARAAGHYAAGNGYQDLGGARAMAYYTEQELPYYYYMATQFAMSDRFFSSMPTRTDPNRIALFAATTAGHAYPLGDPHNPQPAQLNIKTIIELLDNAKVSWKIYTPEDTSTGARGTYFTDFVYANSHLDSTHLVDVARFSTDAQAGTLPSVALIETGSEEATGGGSSTAIDEHPQDDIQVGAAYVADKINTLMNSPSWKDSVFFFLYDEGGGFYDHVPPPAVPSPDGISPIDLASTDNRGDFTITGFRVPFIAISPFSKKNYVSHTVMDTTAVLKFIETRYGLPSLTKRDASMPDMTELFDFAGAPWATPPSNIPAQPTDLSCSLNPPY